MKINYVVISAIIVIGILETIALIKGINGTLLTLTVGAIAGLAGWRIPNGQKN